jgi:hypothetical protein
MPRQACARSSMGRGRLRAHAGFAASALLGPTIYTPGEFTPEGYALTTNQPPWQPSRVPPAKNGDPRAADPTKHFLPPQTPGPSATR